MRDCRGVLPAALASETAIPPGFLSREIDGVGWLKIDALCAWFLRRRRQKNRHGRTIRSTAPATAPMTAPAIAPPLRLCFPTAGVGVDVGVEVEVGKSGGPVTVGSGRCRPLQRSLTWLATQQLSVALGLDFAQ